MLSLQKIVGYMDLPENDPYGLVEKSIDFVKTHKKEVLHLEKLAKITGLTHDEFQLLFKNWCGVDPQQFFGMISSGRIKDLLSGSREPVLFNFYGKTIPDRQCAHISFVELVKMTAFEAENNGQNLTLNYSWNKSPFGKIMVVSSAKGVCYMAFERKEPEALANAKKRFPNAVFMGQSDELQEAALAIFQKNWDHLSKIKLHVNATDFQLKVWKALLEVPVGELTTYRKIAEQIGKPAAHRAVGTAIARNPVAYIVPCHRVVQSGGDIGEYMWGSTRKMAIIGWEAAGSFVG